KSNFNPPPPRKRPLLPPPPPPPARAQAQSPRSKNETTPKAPANSAAKLKSLGVMNVTGASRSYSDKIQTVLELLPDLEVVAPMLPAARLLEDEGDAERTLELALESRTRLPLDSLMSLLKSDDQDIARLAALNLAVSATGRDITRIEEASKKAAPVSSERTRVKTVE